MSRPSNFNQINSDHAIAICTHEQAEQLVHYDHHQVNILSRRGVLLTHEWTPIEKHIGPFVLTVVFHQTENYPIAPDEIQALVNKLSFQARGQPR